MSGFIAEDGKGHKLNISQKMMTELGTFNDEKLKKWRIEAAQRCHASLGPFPALCFSGGIDSQAMLHCFAEADLEAHVVIFTFKDDLERELLTFICQLSTSSINIFTSRSSKSNSNIIFF